MKETKFNISKLSNRDKKLKILEDHFELNDDPVVREKILNEYLYLIELNNETKNVLKKVVKWEMHK